MKYKAGIPLCGDGEATRGLFAKIREAMSSHWDGRNTLFKTAEQTRDAIRAAMYEDWKASQ